MKFTSTSNFDGDDRSRTVRRTRFAARGGAQRRAGPRRYSRSSAQLMRDRGFVGMSARELAESLEVARRTSSITSRARRRSSTKSRRNARVTLRHVEEILHARRATCEVASVGRLYVRLVRSVRRSCSCVSGSAATYAAASETRDAARESLPSSVAGFLSSWHRRGPLPSDGSVLAE